MTKTIILSSGGTGGHVFPALSLAAELHARGYDVVIMTDHRGQAFQKAEGVSKVISLPVWRNSNWPRLSPLFLGAGLAVSFLYAFVYILFTRPRSVVGFGGYPSIPAVLAGYALRIPTALHEQNALLGRANRFLGKFAKRIALSFEKTKYTELFKEKLTYTGNPVRQGIVALREKGYLFPKNDQPFRLLITGGSQGARVFSTAIPSALRTLPKEVRERLIVWQQCRPEFLEMTQEAYRQSGIFVELQTFFADMDRRLQEAHLVIARAGASTVAELTTVGRPALLVPFPFAMDDHQKDNAMSLSENGAAWVVLEKDLTSLTIQEIVTNALDDDQKLRRMASQMHALGQPEAAQKLAGMVEELRN